MAAVVGRDRELEALRRFLDLPVTTTRTLVVEGEAGIGKSTLWQSAVELARARGYLVLDCRGDRSETGVSLVALRDLVGGVFEGVSRELPAPQRRALAVVLLLEEPPDGPPSVGTIAVAFLTLLRTLSGRGPVLLAVDDTQWIDTASAAPLAYALRRLRTEPIAVLLSRRTEPQGAEALALDRLEGERLELGGLSVGALARILQSRLGVAYPRSTLRRIHETSGGNPLYALELARALGDPLGPLPPASPLPVPQTLQQLVTERLEALPAATLELLGFAAALSRPTLEALARVGGREPLPDLTPAIDAQLVVLDGETVQFVHPLFVAGAYGLVSPSRRVSLHRRLAEIVSDVEQRARHLALATEGPDLQVALAVEEGARAAFARGAPGAAAELLALALRVSPQSPQEALLQRKTELAAYHLVARNLVEAAGVLTELVDVLPPGRARADALLKLARARQHESLEQSLTLAEAALADAGAEPDVAARIQCYLAYICFTQGLSARWLGHARAGVRAAEQAGDDGLLAEALTVLAWAETIGRAEPTNALERALALDDGMRPIYGDPSLLLGLRLMYRGRLDEARAQLESVGARAQARGDDFLRSGVLIHLTDVECRAGNWEAAARHVDEIAAHHQATSGLQWARGLVAAHLGRADETREAAELGIALAEEAGTEFFRMLNVCVLGFLELSLGDYAAADRVLRPAAARLAEWCPEPSVLGELPNAIEALVELGELVEAERLLGELDERLPRLENPASEASAGRCRGMIRAARGDSESAFAAYDAALEAHERLPHPFERARTLLAFGTAQRRARRRAAARETLGQALAAFEELGAELWAAKARAELARIGGRAATPGELTPSERRIAELVADGKTNKEVAAALVVASHTVESALTQIYRKVGVRSRTELSRKLADD
jgi:DNA-binding CsgD family transcriptional regulator/tetratricopeptide (TPR) repeat protein